MIGNPFITNDKEKRIQNPVSSIPKDYWGWKDDGYRPPTDQQLYDQQSQILSTPDLSEDERAMLKRQMLNRMMGVSGASISPQERAMMEEQYDPEQKKIIKDLGWQTNKYGVPIIPEEDIRQIDAGIELHNQRLPIDRRTEMILRVMTDLYDAPKVIREEPKVTSEDIGL